MCQKRFLNKKQKIILHNFSVQEPLICHKTNKVLQSFALKLSDWPLEDRNSRPVVYCNANSKTSGYSSVATLLLVMTRISH